MDLDIFGEVVFAIGFCGAIDKLESTALHHTPNTLMLTLSSPSPITGKFSTND